MRPELKFWKKNKMQIVSSKQNIIEKIIRDKEGRLVRATFCVYENGGRIKAKLVDYVYITAGAICGKVLSLGGNMSRTVLDTKSLSFNSKIVSPFFSLDSLLYSTGSKPRAPTIF